MHMSLPGGTGTDNDWPRNCGDTGPATPVAAGGVRADATTCIVEGMLVHVRRSNGVLLLHSAAIHGGTQQICNNLGI